jgi:hypothetical protein
MNVTGLISFWLAFPDDPTFPIGFGVTAWSVADAQSLLESNGYDFHLRAKRVLIREAVTPDAIDPKNVAPNSGPHVCRGVWYPALNVGFGAPIGRMGNV